LTGEDKFTFTSPADQSGIYAVLVNFYDEPENNSSVLFKFDIEDVSDKPDILLSEEFFEINKVNKDAFFVEESEDISERHLRLLHLEGEVQIAELFVSDAKDSPPASSFTWKLVGGDGLFRLEDLSDSCRLYWDLPIEENNGLPDYESMGGQEYEFYVTVQENMSPFFIQQLKIVISVEEVPNKRPVFVPADPRSYIFENFPEEKDTEIVTIQAVDPDNEPGKADTIILKSLLPELDYLQFEFDDVSGRLSFKSPRDYENPKDLGLDNKYQVLIQIVEFNEEAKSNQMLVEVQVANNIEPPRFESRYSEFNKDVNFTIVEQKTEYFEINATTLDLNKNLLIEIAAEGPDDHLFEFNSSSNQLSFIFPPDYENPESIDGDNIYTVLMKVSPVIDGRPSYYNSVIEPFYIEVLDDNFTFEIIDPLPPAAPLSQLKIFENEPFVVDIDVYDAETPVKFPDLLYTTQLKSGFIPHQKNADSAKDAYDSSFLKPVSSSLDWAGRYAVSADFRNAGINDVVVLSSRSMMYFENDGAGQFSSNQAVMEMLSASIEGTPTFALAEDLNFDGSVDLLVCFHDFAENKPGIALFLNSKDMEVPLGGTVYSLSLDPSPQDMQLGKISEVVAQDIDGDYDLDLVVAYLNDNEVLWYSNNGSGMFSFAGVVANVLRPRALEIINLKDATKLADPFACRDLLIGSDEGLTLVENNAKNFDRRPLSEQGEVSSICALDLLGNKRADLVFIQDDQLKVSLGLASGFGVPIIALSDQSKYVGVQSGWSEKPLKPSFITPFYFGQSEIPSILIGEINQPFVFQLKHRELDNEPKIVFDVTNVLKVDQDSGLKSLQILDLDRRVDVVEYSFYQPPGRDVVSENASLFDEVKFGAGGKLFFKRAPDFENKKDFALGNEYEIVVEARKKPAYQDQETQFDQKYIRVEVLPVNEPPLFTNLPTYVDHAEHTFEIFESIEIFNPESNASIYLEDTEGFFIDIVSGQDEEVFEINASNGNLRFRSDVFQVDPLSGLVTFDYLPNFESPKDFNEDNTYNLVLRVTDDAGNFSEEEIFINIVDGSVPPAISPIFNPLQQTITEDGLLQLDLDDLGVTDPLNSSSGTIEYSIFDSPSYGSVNIEADSMLLYKPTENYFGTDQLFVQASNSNGVPVVVKIEVQVLALNDIPVSEVPDFKIVKEDSMVVLNLEAYDVEGDELVWETKDPNDSIFQVDKFNTLKFKESRFADYESDDSRFGYVAELVLYEINSTNQTKQNPFQHNLTVMIENLADSPPVSNVLSEKQVTFLEIPENRSFVVDLDIFDPDGIEDPNATIRAGADMDSFKLSKSGVLETVSPVGFDFEFPRDSNGDNIYELFIDVNDSALGRTYQVFFTVTDLDENPPFYMSGEGAPFYQLGVPEDRTKVTQVLADDNETDSLVYRIAKGADADFFTIDETNGSLSFLVLQNFEQPMDSNNDGVFEVVIGVSDGTFETNQTIYVELENAPDAPALTRVNYTILEDEIMNQVFEAFDEDGDIPEFKLHTQASNGFVSTFGNSFTYQPTLNFYGLDAFDVLISDDFSSRIQTIYIEVQPLNDPPVAVDDIKYFYQSNRTRNPVITINVIQNDHSGSDDPEEENLYQVERLKPYTTANGNTLAPPSAGGVFTYRPPAKFLGEDSFQYRLLDQGLQDIATVRIWVATSADLPEWTNLLYFGAYYREPEGVRSNWIYHVDMGWVYVDQIDQILDSSWMWREYLGWFWTGDKYFNWLYSDYFKKWMHWEGGTSLNQDWFVRDEENNSYNEAYFIRKIREAEEKAAQEKREAELREQRERELAAKNKIRDEIIALLPSVPAVLSYVGTSSYFSQSSRTSIAYELARQGKSVTLNNLFNYQFKF